MSTLRRRMMGGAAEDWDYIFTPEASGYMVGHSLQVTAGQSVIIDYAASTNGSGVIYNSPSVEYVNPKWLRPERSPGPAGRVQIEILKSCTLWIGNNDGGNSTYYGFNGAYIKVKIFWAWDYMLYRDPETGIVPLFELNLSVGDVLIEEHNQSGSTNTNGYIIDCRASGFNNYLQSRNWNGGDSWFPILSIDGDVVRRQLTVTQAGKYVFSGHYNLGQTYSQDCFNGAWIKIKVIESELQ